jgi:hypothetical protein
MTECLVMSAWSGVSAGWPSWWRNTGAIKLGRSRMKRVRPPSPPRFYQNLTGPVSMWTKSELL